MCEMFILSVLFVLTRGFHSESNILTYQTLTVASWIFSLQVQRATAHVQKQTQSLMRCNERNSSEMKSSQTAGTLNSKLTVGFLDCTFRC